MPAARRINAVAMICPLPVYLFILTGINAPTGCRKALSGQIGCQDMTNGG
jgi:hypothetical protein